jgi:uncharacterized phiE125 gp8 family phage protein
MPVSLITPPTYEPVPLNEVKLNLRADDSSHDMLLENIIPAARDWVERRVQTKFATQTWELTLDGFPASEIELPFGPVQSITSVKYDDEDAVETTLSTSLYRLSGGRYLVPVDEWPSAADGASVRIRFVAGYPATSPIPESVRLAIILKVMELHDGADVSRQIDSLLTNHLQFAV